MPAIGQIATVRISRYGSRPRVEARKAGGHGFCSGGTTRDGAKIEGDGVWDERSVVFKHFPSLDVDKRTSSPTVKFPSGGLPLNDHPLDVRESGVF